MNSTRLLSLIRSTLKRYGCDDRVLANLVRKNGEVEDLISRKERLLKVKKELAAGVV